MDLAQGLFLITFIHLLAAAAPGPDFVMVTQQTLVNGRRSGLLCSLGIALGLSVHIPYSALGLAAVIANSAFILAIIKVLGGCYLIFLGFKGLRAKPKHMNVDEVSIKKHESLRTVGIGFLCNALNPKAPIYFVALFTVVLSPEMPLYQIAIYGVWIMVIQLAWFSLVATVLASPPVSRRFSSYSHYLERLLGGAMLLLGVKVLATKTG